MIDLYSSVADPAFLELLVGYDIPDLDADPCTIFGTWPDLRLAYMNAAWFRFAAANGGEPQITHDWPLGRAISDSFPDVLKRYYTTALQRTLESGEPWRHRYECSSANIYREFMMHAYPLAGGRGLLMVNSSLVERLFEPGEITERPAVESLYSDSEHITVQCSHCRRVRRLSDDRQWDWVPQWVSRPPRDVSHGLCPICLSHYYSGL